MALPETLVKLPKLESWIVRYELSDSEWAAIKPSCRTNRAAFGV
jgi:hypothetical protein